MNPTTEAPINRLPNEMMLLIMAKLGLDVDVKKLIRLRLVSMRWRSVVEDYCQMKKSLIVVIKPSAIIDRSSDYFNFYLSNFEKRFFGSASFNDFTRLVLRSKIASKCLKALLNLFPNIVQLSVYSEDNKPTRFRDFVAYLKSLDSLKQLDLDGGIIKALPHLSQNILSKLELIAYNEHKDILNEDHFCQFISHLGPDCVCFNFGGSQFNCEHILRWHSLNPTWLSNVTHLRISFTGTSECHSKVVSHLIEHTTSLMHFKANFYGNSFELTPTVIRNFSIDLWNVEITKLEHAEVSHQANSQSSLLVFKLFVTDQSWWNTVNYRPASGDQFTRILSAAFPNLVYLDFALDLEFGNFDQFTHEIELNLYQFPKLRKHKLLNYYSYVSQ